MEKIAFILPDLRGGGAEKSVSVLLNELCRRELCPAIDLVLVKAVGVFLKDVPTFVRVVDLGRERAMSSLWPLVRYLRTARPRVVFAHLSHINLLAAAAIRLAGARTALVVVEHGILPAESGFRWLRWAMRKSYPSAAAVVAVSKNAAQNIAFRLRMPEEKVKTIYNPVVTAELLKAAEKTPSHPWFEKKEVPVILGVGRLVKEKDFANLIRAVTEVKKQRPVRLVILGEGDERKALEELVLQLGVQNEVWMPGFAENPYGYMASSDAFVLSSLKEGLGNVLIEAMACGCPVIATDCPGGPGEILGNGVFGPLVPVGNVSALADTILRVLESPVRKERLVERAALFSAKRAGDAYLSLLKEIIMSGKKEIVLHIITGLRTGGAERMLCQLLAAVDRQRWEPVVISLTDGSAPETWLREQGITVYTLGMRPGRLPSPALCIKLIRLVRSIRPALIHGWMYHANLAAQLANCFLWPGVGVCWSVHHSVNALSAEKKMTAGVIRLGTRFSRLPDAIVYASRVSRQQHAALGYDDRKARVIPNGVDPEVFVPCIDARVELGLADDVPVIGSLARYHPIKDHENFLRAAAILRSRPEGLTVQFVLAGAGVDADNAELQALIMELGLSGTVHLLGERSDPQRLLPALDLFTVSSYAEAFPMVLLEAMACAVPCVTTDVGDAALIVAETGKVVAPRDPVALADGWSALLVAGKEKRRELGAAARQRVIENYTLAVCARSYEELYVSLKG